MNIDFNFSRLKMSKGNLFVKDVKFYSWVEWRKSFDIIGFRSRELLTVK